MSKKFFSASKITYLLIFIFLFTRLFNLTLLPIFTDESIYIYWAKYIATFHSHLFMSLTDGKPPLFIWVIAVFLKIFPSSMYLFAGRLVSVIAGAMTCFGVYILTNFFFSKKAAIIAAIFCILNPFMLFHDRMALYDSMLSACLIWSVYFAVKTAKTFSKKDAALWGLFLGFGLLTKPPAVIFLLLTPLCFILFMWTKEWKKQLKEKVVVVSIAIVVAELLNSIQRLSFNYALMTQKNENFQVPVTELFSAPVTILGKNLLLLFSWIISYYTLPMFLAGVCALIVLLYKDIRKGVVFLLLWFVPILAFATVGKILFSRYILFTTPYFLIPLAVVTQEMFKKKNKIIVVGLLLIVSVYFDFFLLINPIKAPLPIADHEQYITSEYSGYGLEDSFQFLDNALANGPRVTLVTEGKFGLFPYAFNLYYWQDSRISIYPSWIPEKKDFNLYDLAKSSKVYVVFSRQKNVPEDFSLKMVKKITKPENKHDILITELKDK